MKKLFVVALIAIGMTAFAQENKMQPLQKGKADFERMTPEQRNELQLKKMTLDLGLSDVQQKQMKEIIVDQQTKRQAWAEERKINKEKGLKQNADERYKKESKMLDEKIAVKESVKKILTPEQFKKWEEMNAQKKEKMQNGKSDRRKKDIAPTKE